MILSVCVGSSCHLQGSYRIIHEFQQLIQEHGLEDEITLQANFCAGRCQHAVAVKLGEDSCVELDMTDVDGFFNDHVLGALRHE
ncbi:(2Fe-2S) ferredoxin domain-containing protein [Gorillibacterium sp. CAU 1737]|uniref:(2Fe-2S) ferredoxin domain-containing protein n=1 Tax=Gorillibacterium sp. CAU 1737 TaxID=3140362 RepID=UPI003261C31D